LSDPASLLAVGARELGVTLDDRQNEQLMQLLAELADWNKRFNLTAIDDPLEAVRKHLLDSLSIHAHLGGRRVADVGSGAGFPGLPLAVANPAREFTLIEATGKKAAFLEHARAHLGLTNVTIVNSRAEQFKPAHGFDSVTARALGKLNDFIRVAGHLVARGGMLLAMKGREPREELGKLPKGWSVKAIHRLVVPGLDAQRHLVELRPHGSQRSAAREH
jgi:16S rRNA (guanine527-N7)-methyltransferase